jgi:hypothetical protein
MAGVDRTCCRHTRLIQERLAKSLAVDGIIRGLADELVVPGFGVEVQRVGPVMWVGTHDDLEAIALKSGNGIGRGHLDEVHLPRAQCGQSRRGFGHGEENQLVDVGHASLIPVFGEGLQFNALSREQAGKLEGAGPCRVHRDLAPIPAHFLPLGRTAIQDRADLEEDRAGGATRGDLDRIVIELAPALHQGSPPDHLGGLFRVILWCLFILDLIEIPNDCISIKIRAIVELHSRTQVENPLGRIISADLPALG